MLSLPMLLAVLASSCNDPHYYQPASLALMISKTGQLYTDIGGQIYAAKTGNLNFQTAYAPSSYTGVFIEIINAAGSKIVL